MDPGKPIESTGLPCSDLSLSSTRPESSEHLNVIDLPGGKWQGTSAFSRTGQNKAWLWATTHTQGLLNREKGVDLLRSKEGRERSQKYIWRSEELEAWMFLELNNCFPKKWMCGRISNSRQSISYIYELRMANKNILSQYNSSRLLAVKIIFTWFPPVIRDQGCVKAEKALDYIAYWLVKPLSRLRGWDHSCFLKYRSSVKSLRTYYKMEKKWLFPKWYIAQFCSPLW